MFTAGRGYARYREATGAHTTTATAAVIHRCFHTSRVAAAAANPYIVLHVDPSATLQQIKAAYRILALKHHPDVHAEQSEKIKAAAATRFIEISHAYTQASLYITDPATAQLRQAADDANTVWQATSTGHIIFATIYSNSQSNQERRKYMMHRTSSGGWGGNKSFFLRSR